MSCACFGQRNSPYLFYKFCASDLVALGITFTFLAMKFIVLVPYKRMMMEEGTTKTIVNPGMKYLLWLLRQVYSGNILSNGCVLPIYLSCLSKRKWMSSWTRKYANSLWNTESFNTEFETLPQQLLRKIIIVRLTSS